MIRCKDSHHDNHYLIDSPKFPEHLISAHERDIRDRAPVNYCVFVCLCELQCLCVCVWVCVLLCCSVCVCCGMRVVLWLSLR